MAPAEGPTRPNAPDRMDAQGGNPQGVDNSHSGNAESPEAAALQAEILKLELRIKAIGNFLKELSLDEEDALSLTQAPLSATLLQRELRWARQPFQEGKRDSIRMDYVNSFGEAILFLKKVQAGEITSVEGVTINETREAYLRILKEERKARLNRLHIRGVILRLQAAEESLNKTLLEKNGHMDAKAREQACQEFVEVVQQEVRHYADSEDTLRRRSPEMDFQEILAAHYAGHIRKVEITKEALARMHDPNMERAWGKEEGDTHVLPSQGTLRRMIHMYLDIPFLGKKPELDTFWRKFETKLTQEVARALYGFNTPADWEAVTRLIQKIETPSNLAEFFKHLGENSLLPPQRQIWLYSQLATRILNQLQHHYDDIKDVDKYLDRLNEATPEQIENAATEKRFTWKCIQNTQKLLAGLMNTLPVEQIPEKLAEFILKTMTPEIVNQTALAKLSNHPASKILHACAELSLKIKKGQKTTNANAKKRTVMETDWTQMSLVINPKTKEETIKLLLEEEPYPQKLLTAIQGIERSVSPELLQTVFNRVKKFHFQTNPDIGNKPQNELTPEEQEVLNMDRMSTYGALLWLVERPNISAGMRGKVLQWGLDHLEEPRKSGLMKRTPYKDIYPQITGKEYPSGWREE